MTDHLQISEAISIKEKTYTIILTNVTGDRKRALLSEAGFDYDYANKTFIKKDAKRSEVLYFHELIQCVWPKVIMSFRSNG